MKTMIIFTILMNVIFLLISAIIMFIENRRSKKKVEKELSKLDITNKFSVISIKLSDYQKAGLLENTPSIEAYLEQAHFVVLNCPYDIDKLSVGSVYSKIANKNFEPLVDLETIKKIPDELNYATKDAKDLLSDFLSLIDEFYKLYHPVKFQMKKVGREVQIFVIKLIIKFLKLVISIKKVNSTRTNTKELIDSSENYINYGKARNEIVMCTA